MSLPPGLLIVLTEGDYSDKRIIGIFDNLNDVESMFENCWEFTLEKKDSYCPNTLITRCNKFPTAEILNNLEQPLYIWARCTTERNSETLYYDFEWYVLNNKYDEFLYAPGGQKYKEAEEKIEKLSTT